MRTLVKICGLTNEADVRCVADAGADFAGFILYAKSARYVEPGRLRDLTKLLPAAVTRVGVFVNAEPGFIREAVCTGDLDIVQLHGDESAEFAASLAPIRLWRAFGLSVPADVARATEFPAEAVLVDAISATERGGTGRRADWTLAASLAGRRRTVLAGGLSPDNVAEAIHTVRPFAVDVSSGVEVAKGRKDHASVRRFINTVRQTDSKD